MRRPHFHAWCAASLELAVAAPSLHAQDLPETIAASVSPASPASPKEQIWHTVADAQLDRMRGGFDVGGGLMVSLGIQ